MLVAGISITKRKITLALVKHRNLIELSEEPKWKPYSLVELKYLYIPKNIIANPVSLFYSFDNLSIIKECDICRVLHSRDKKTKAETLAIKELIYLLIIEQLKKIKKKNYTESAKTLQYRMGKGRFENHEKVLGWLLKNVDNLEKSKLLNNRGIIVQSVLTIATACSSKKAKYDW